MRYLNVICSACVGLVVGCAQEAPVSPREGDGILPSPTRALSEIDGDWSSPCVRGATEYVQYHVTFDRGNYKQRNQFHPDINCRQIQKPAALVQGAFSLGETYTTIDGLQVKELKISIAEGGDVWQYRDLVYMSNGILYFGKLTAASAERPNQVELNEPYTRVR